MVKQQYVIGSSHWLHPFLDTIFYDDGVAYVMPLPYPEQLSVDGISNSSYPASLIEEEFY